MWINHPNQRSKPESMRNECQHYNPNTPMNLPFLLARLDDISKAREEDLYLAVFPDQSGSVCALIDDSLVFEFATLSELQEWLDQQPGGQMAAPAAEREENS